MSTTETQTIEELANKEYKYGFVTDIEADTIPKGLNEDVVRQISAKKQEPEWLMEWRLKAYRHWLTMEEPQWSNVIMAIDYQDIIIILLQNKPKLIVWMKLILNFLKTFKNLVFLWKNKKFCWCCC